MGNEDLGKHFESIGDLNGAAESYSKMRPDVSTPKQIVDVGKRCVSSRLATSMASTQFWSRVASGSEGAAIRRHSTASRYLWMSRPRFASTTAAFKASTHK